MPHRRVHLLNQNFLFSIPSDSSIHPAGSFPTITLQSRHQRTIRQQAARLPDAAHLARWLADHVTENDPWRVIQEGELLARARTVQALLDSGYKRHQVRRAVEFSQHDTFWRPVVVSAEKLEEHISALVMRATAAT
jgi:hypothetical protein